MHTNFCLLVLLVGFIHIDGAQTESTTKSSMTKNISEMSADTLKKMLMEAVAENDEALVSETLAHPEAKHFDQYFLRKALTLAARNNYVPIAQGLIQAGADIKEEYCCALEDAAEKGYKDMVQTLLPVQGCDKRDYSRSHFMDINYLNKHRDNALIKAAKHGHADVMQELLSAGAKVNYQNHFGDTALVEAANGGHIQAVKALLQAKANVNAPNGNGTTALQIAMRTRNIDLLRELLTAPKINVSWYISDIKRKHEDYLKSSELAKSLFYDETDVKIFELFEPFIIKS